MENMDLNNAEVAVTTQHILDGKEYKDYWVQMSDYSDMGEFLCACSDLFPEETDPEYRYAKWENIPDRLINRVDMSQLLRDTRCHGKARRERKGVFRHLERTLRI